MKRNIFPGLLLIAVITSSIFGVACKDKKTIGPSYTDWTSPSKSETSAAPSGTEAETTTAEPTATPTPEPTATPTPSPSPTPVPEYVEPTIEGGPVWYSGYVDPSINFTAHAGGFVAGMLICFFMTLGNGGKIKGYAS